MLSNSYARAWLAEAGACLAAALALVGVAHADQQQDPELKAVVQQAIGEAECFTDHYDSAVWYTLMEPRLRKIVKEKDERLEILKQVYCETHRAGEARLPPGLVMGVIEVESRFERYAVSSAAAVGLMQVMPFWPRQLGVQNQLVKVAPNIRMGCEILRYYLRVENRNWTRALARYNGSVGRNSYPALVMQRWQHFWRF
jgi:soluble lytic murein transglycosylase-like protein